MDKNKQNEYYALWMIIKSKVRVGKYGPLDQLDIYSNIAEDNFLFFCVDRMDPVPVIYTLEARRNLQVANEYDQIIYQNYMTTMMLARAKDPKESIIENLLYIQDTNKADSILDHIDFQVKQGLLYRYRYFEALIKNFKRYVTLQNDPRLKGNALAHIGELPNYEEIDWETEANYNNKCVIPAAIYASERHDIQMTEPEWARVCLKAIRMKDDLSVTQILTRKFKKNSYLKHIVNGIIEGRDTRSNLVRYCNGALEAVLLDADFKFENFRGKKYGNCFLDDSAGMETIKNIYALTENHPEVKIFLCYGTLLGWARDDRLISYDKDLDFGLLRDESAMSSLRRAIISDAHYKFIYDGEYNWALKDLKTGMSFDIFFFEQKEKNSKVTIQTSINTKFDHIFPSFHLKKETFKDLTVMVPANYLEILEASYGKNWSVPDPNFDTLIQAPNIADKAGSHFLFHCVTQIIFLCGQDGGKKSIRTIDHLLENELVSDKSLINLLLRFKSRLSKSPEIVGGVIESELAA